MEQQQQTTATSAASGQTVSGELIRPIEGRVLAGVSQGIADRFDLPVWIPRAFFIITAIFGGVGVLLYVAGWALMRGEGESDTVVERLLQGTNSWRSWLGIGLLFIAAMILLDQLTFLPGGVIWAVALLAVGFLLYSGQLPIRSETDRIDDPKEGVQQMTTKEDLHTDVGGDSPTGGATTPPTPPVPTPTPPLLPPNASKPKERSILGRVTLGLAVLGMGILAIFDTVPNSPIEPRAHHYLALAVTIIGVGLLVGAFAGRARWLILVAVVLMPTLLFSPLFNADWTLGGDSFDLLVEPQTFTEVEDFYSLDVGNLVIDLTELPWDGQTLDITARVDAGNLEIRLPADVGIVGEASVDVGRVADGFRESTGLGNPSLTFDETGSEGTVLLDAAVDVGNIDIDR